MKRRTRAIAPLHHGRDMLFGVRRLAFLVEGEDERTAVEDIEFIGGAGCLDRGRG